MASPAGSATASAALAAAVQADLGVGSTTGPAIVLAVLPLAQATSGTMTRPWAPDGECDPRPVKVAGISPPEPLALTAAASAGRRESSWSAVDVDTPAEPARKSSSATMPPIPSPGPQFRVPPETEQGDTLHDTSRDAGSERERLCEGGVNELCEPAEKTTEVVATDLADEATGKTEADKPGATASSPDDTQSETVPPCSYSEGCRGYGLIIHKSPGGPQAERTVSSNFEAATTGEGGRGG